MKNKIESYWLYGMHAVRAALANNKREIRRMMATSNALERLENELDTRNIKPEIKSAHEIGSVLPSGSVHQGIAIEVKPLAHISLEEYLKKAGTQKPLVLLDQVTDPHNVGAILRTAAAFDAGAIIVTKDHAPQESATLAKASSGGIEIVPIITVTNLAQAMETLKKNDYWCVGLSGEAKQTLASAKLNHKTALVLGAEGSGLRRLTVERCDLLVRLPISQKMESLNVSNAAAIALYALTAKD